MLKKVLIISLSVIEAFVLYYGICHIVAGINAPVLVGENGKAFFMGLNITGFIFMSLFAILLIAIIMICLYMKPKGNKNEKG